jgi:beta-lactamase class A
MPAKLPVLFPSFRTLSKLVSTFSCVLLSASLSAQDSALSQTVMEIEDQLNARLGAAVLVVGSDRSWQYRGDELFPLSSTFKPLACAALLQRVDASTESLDRIVPVKNTDLVSYSPVTETRVDSVGMSLAELCDAAITVSDNTAGNLVLAAIEGPAGLTHFMGSIGDRVTRLDRWETELNEARPGDYRDTTSPLAMAEAIEKLVLGEVLSASSREKLSGWLKGNTVGEALFRATIPDNWEIGDKSGAGGYGSRSIAAILWPPSGSPVIATVYITETDASFDERNAAIAEIGAAIAGWVAEQ